jgi:ribosome-associated toxin RatA of RatAB toxin-antitoxin module
VRAHLLLTAAAVLGAALTAAAADGTLVSVQENAAGAYVVTARFRTGEAPEIARAVLTDYVNIPRFMPDIRASEVVERQDGLVRVNQEAVSEYMFFSKRVHLSLDVEEGLQTIRFRDRCNRSFHVYEGAWTLTPRENGTELTYELVAKPAFSVPGFIIRKLLNRDARVMLERLQAEMAARGAGTTTAR